MNTTGMTQSELLSVICEINRATLPINSLISAIKNRCVGNQPTGGWGVLRELTPGDEAAIALHVANRETITDAICARHGVTWDQLMDSTETES